MKQLLDGPAHLSHAFSHARLFEAPWDCSLPGFSLCPWNSPGKKTVVVCHSLLQTNFPTQGLNPGFLHHRQITGVGNMRILKWVAIPISSGSSQPRDQTQVSSIVGRFKPCSSMTLKRLGFISRFWIIFVIIQHHQSNLFKIDFF